MTKRSLIGELLIREGLIDSPGLDAALLEVQSKSGIFLGKALADLGFAKEEDVTSAIAKGLHLESSEC